MSCSYEEAKKLIKNPDTVIIDVRTYDEYKYLHVKNSINFFLGDIPSDFEKKFKDKDQTILVCCTSGRMSSYAKIMLDNMNYNNVYDIGGINSWKGEKESLV